MKEIDSLRKDRAYLIEVLARRGRLDSGQFIITGKVLIKGTLKELGELE